MDDDKIDLSALGPEPKRYEQMVQAVSARGVDALRARNTLSGQLMRWARPVLAVAALAAVAGAFALTRPQLQARSGVEASMLGWAMRGYGPSDLELFSTL